MRHFYIACALILFILPNCGKKDSSTCKKKTKKVASIENEVKESVDSLLASNEENNETNIASSDFSFIDDRDSFVEKDTEKLASLDLQETENTALKEEGLGEEGLEEENELAAENENNFKNIEFEFNYNRMKLGQKEALNKNIETAKKAVAEGKAIVVDGHTCQMGPASYNLALSLKRADVVKKEMVKKGIPEESIKVMGHGNENPLVSTTKISRMGKIEELSPNRRTEIRIS
jgi:outer membrane protein OmpA-like peptidoglycan-associated protein